MRLSLILTKTIRGQLGQWWLTIMTLSTKAIFTSSVGMGNGGYAQRKESRLHVLLASMYVLGLGMRAHTKTQAFRYLSEQFLSSERRGCESLFC